MRLSIPNKTHPNNAEAGLDRKEEQVKNARFSKFWPTFRYFSGTLPKIHTCFFNDIFAAPDIHTYFKIIPIHLFMKTFFSDDIERSKRLI